MSDETANQEEQEKNKLVIEVLDKGLLGSSQAGVLANILAGPTWRDKCGSCDAACSGCVGRCVSGCLEV